MKVYTDPLFPKGQILMGYKGASVMDSGYFYAPYVDLQQSPVVLQPGAPANAEPPPEATPVERRTIRRLDDDWTVSMDDQ